MIIVLYLNNNNIDLSNWKEKWLSKEFWANQSLMYPCPGIGNKRTVLHFITLKVMAASYLPVEHSQGYTIQMRMCELYNENLFLWKYLKFPTVFKMLHSAIKMANISMYLYILWILLKVFRVGINCCWFIELL